jgi:hypothetical protein
MPGDEHRLQLFLFDLERSGPVHGGLLFEFEDGAKGAGDGSVAVDLVFHASEPLVVHAAVLEPAVEKYGLDPLGYDAFPGKIPGPSGDLEDKTEPELVRSRAEELAARL